METFDSDQHIWLLAVSSDGHLSGAGKDKGELKVLDVATGDFFATLPEHAGKSFWLQWSPDGEYLAASSETGPL